MVMQQATEFDFLSCFYISKLDPQKKNNKEPKYVRTGMKMALIRPQYHTESNGTCPDFGSYIPRFIEDKH